MIASVNNFMEKEYSKGIKESYIISSPPMIKTIPELDRLVGGFFRGELINIVGSTGAGKTSFSVAMATQIQKQKQKHVLFAKNILYINMSYSEPYVSNLFSKTSEDKHAEGSVVIKQFREKIGFDELERFIRQIYNNKKSIDAVFIDDFNELIKHVSRDFLQKLRQLAGELRFVAVTISQSYKGEISLASMPNSMSIAQLADKVIGIENLPDNKKNFWRRLMFWKKRVNFTVEVLKNRTDGERKSKGFFDFENLKLKLYGNKVK